MRRSTVAAITAVASLAILGGCRGSETTAPSRTIGADVYDVTIHRTSYGIPHIVADDLASLGFGEGYAFAQDHLCSLADQVVFARGERAKYFGRGTNDEHLQSDATVRAIGLHRQASEQLAAATEEIQGWMQGYADGYNHYLDETGADNLGGWCRGAAWVGPIDAADLVAYRQVFSLLAPRFAARIATAAPPNGADSQPPSTAAVAAAPDVALASNAWGIGSERSASGRGMLLANPHYPWEGSNRFWEKHLQVNGDFDIYGVSLLGSPGVAIGFNEAIGWSHTVSAGQRFTLYRLELAPGDPTSYLYDGETRAMRKQVVEVEVLGDDGTTTVEARTIWLSHYGPMLDWPGLEWSETQALTYRDANEANDESTATYLAMARAESMDEFQAAHDLQGISFVNTTSTSAEGRAWYADVSAAPMLSEATLAAWRERLESDPATASAYQSGLILLDGSTSRDDWVEDERARDPGVVPFEEVPQLERRDYVFNANDSHWMSHHEALLEGYSPAHGPEGSARSLRTRMNATTLSDVTPEGPSGADGKFSLDELEAAALSNTSFAALAVLPDLVSRCRETPRVTVDGVTVDLGEACQVLAGYDGHLDLDRAGAVLFREFITRYEAADLLRQGALFADDFDPARPLQTPHSLAEGPLALENLGRAVRLLEGAGHTLDVTLGELQHSNKRGGRIPIHGGNGGYEGVENVVFYSPNRTTMEPSPDPGEPIEGSRFLTSRGYPITYGTSFIMALEYRDDGPHAQAFLTYGESGDEDSAHFVDQTKLFSAKRWRPILYREDEILADPELETTHLRVERASGS